MTEHDINMLAFDMSEKFQRVIQEHDPDAVYVDWNRLTTAERVAWLALAKDHLAKVGEKVRDAKRLFLGR